MPLSVVGKSKTSYERQVRWSLLAACSLTLALSVAGCFKPDVKNGGFACSMTDNPPCPEGFHCVNGLCEDQSGASTGGDLATGTGGNGGSGGSAGGGGGGGGVSTDMAQSNVDLAQPVGDMASSACGTTGDDCTSQACCSGHSCVPVFNVCL